MSRYAADDEQRIRLQHQVREWARAGLIGPEQSASLDARLRTTLRRTNGFLRAALALFTALIVAASMALVFVSLGIHARAETAVAFAVAAVVCVAAAELLVGRFRLYRYGVEETVAVAGALFAGISVGVLAHAPGPDRPGAAALLAGTAGGFALYRRFGFVYAAIAALIAGAFVPGELALSPVVHRIASAAIFLVGFAAARFLHLRRGDDYPGDDYALIEAAAYAGMYVALNLHLTDLFGRFEVATGGRAFYWTTYVATWLLPAAGLTLSIRGRARPLLTVSIALALATLVTNKPYLGWSSESWDPIVFGAFLAAIVTVVRRWLANGPGGMRAGFTAARILERDRDWLRSLATASTAWSAHDAAAARPSDRPPPQFDGGRSGGGGGGAEY